jgi:Alpha-tubulin suppressor and related RCC1 domain-containing proteins
VHTCGISSDGTALCWGGNWFGGLGVGTSTAANTGSETGLATPVKTSQKFTQIAPGGSHTCALAMDSRLWCWGDRGRAQMGDGRD